MWYQTRTAMPGFLTSTTVALTFDDVIIQARNRAYGASDLRRNYRPTLARVLWLGVGLFFSTITGFAQTVDTTVYTIVEKQPEFPGGLEAMRNYLLTNVQYPAEAKKAGIKDRVLTSFVVETDGRITDIQLLKGIGYGCDEEGIRVISAMPRWTPGSQSGKSLRVKYHLPILFGMDYPKARVR